MALVKYVDGHYIHVVNLMNLWQFGWKIGCEEEHGMRIPTYEGRQIEEIFTWRYDLKDQEEPGRVRKNELNRNGQEFMLDIEFSSEACQT